MNVKNFKLATLLLVLTGSLSCNEKVVLGGDVPYKPCSCDEETTGVKYDQKFYQGEAYLFKDSIPEKMGNQIDHEIYSAPFPIVCWIVYYGKIDEASITFYSKSGGMACTGTICNYPDFAKDWIATGNGCKVYYEGQSYKPCNPSGTAEAVYIDYVLTRLIKK